MHNVNYSVSFVRHKSVSYWLYFSLILLNTFIYLFLKFIYLFIFVCVGSSLLRTGFFSSFGQQGPVAVRGPPIVVASLVVEHGL